MSRNLAADSERERIIREIEAQRRAPTFGELQLRAEAEAAAERERLRNRLEAAEARVAEFEAERDALKARLAEVEAGAAAMRDVLQDALSPEDSGWWCPTCKREVPGVEVTYEEHHETCGTYLGGVSSDEWRQHAKAALSSSAGREAAERMRRLEAALRSIPYCAYSEALAEGCDAVGAWDAFREECEAHAKRALEGGEQRA